MNVLEFNYFTKTLDCISVKLSDNIVFTDTTLVFKFKQVFAKLSVSITSSFILPALEVNLA